jgi:hypothetical protein
MTPKENFPMSHLPNDVPTSATDLDRNGEALTRISAALRGLRYGTVTAVVQDGLVVQVERTEKIRLEKRVPRGGS